jgi:hypothetical protein
MRRIDVLLLGLGALGFGAVLYAVLLAVGIERAQAGLWAQASLVGGGGLIWIATYLFRVLTGRMTLHEQLRNYEEAVIDKRIAELSPEQLQKLQEEVEAEQQLKQRTDVNL